MWAFRRDKTVHDRWRIPLTILFYAGKVNGKVRFQKLVFLCLKEENVKSDYTFDLYKYGPFSLDLASDFQSLISEHELVNVEEIPVPSSEATLSIYSLTEKGKKLVQKEILPKMQEKDRKAVLAVVDRYNNLPLNRVLSYVYEKYVS